MQSGVSSRLANSRFASKTMENASRRLTMAQIIDYTGTVHCTITNSSDLHKFGEWLDGAFDAPISQLDSRTRSTPVGKIVLTYGDSTNIILFSAPISRGDGYEKTLDIDENKRGLLLVKDRLYEMKGVPKVLLIHR
jgi:hypothetical protein